MTPSSLTSAHVPRAVTLTLWCLLVPVLAVAGYLALGALLSLLTAGDSVMAMVALGLIAFALVLVLRALRPSWFAIDAAPLGLPRIGGRRGTAPLLVAGQVLLAFLAGQSMALTTYLLIGSDGFDGFNNLEQEHSALLLLAMTLLAAPLGEEALFRGTIYALLRRRVGIWASALVTTSVFALVHGNVVQILSALPLALLLAVLYERTRSLGLCVLAHIAFNVAANVVPVAVIAPLVNPPMAIALGTAAAWQVVVLARQEPAAQS